ncbi:MAG: hypothetical protein WD673_10680 [Alphaproteobacteria bacterium]
MASFIVTLDGGAPWPLDTPVAGETLRSGQSHYSEIHGRDEAEREAFRFVANPARYSVGA